MKINYSTKSYNSNTQGYAMDKDNARHVRVAMLKQEENRKLFSKESNSEQNNNKLGKGNLSSRTLQ